MPPADDFLGPNDGDTGAASGSDAETVPGQRLEPVDGLDEGTFGDEVSGRPQPWVAVLLPVKAFRAAKGRLASALDGPHRAALARDMATKVVHAAGTLPVSIVCDDDEVAEWATGLGAEVIWRPGRGLNGAVTDGVDELAAAGYGQVIVAHADLPYALDLSWVADFDGVTLVPDRRDDGTNVACVPARAGFVFSYGPGSFARHRLEAARRGLPLRIEREARLGWDVDEPADLEVPDWLPAG